MANRMVDVDEGTNTNCNAVGKDTQSLVSHLIKHKLPVDKFVSFGVDINDLINFDDKYFSGLCQDMELNSLESFRFAKLIQELNEKRIDKYNHNQLIQDIDTSFNALIEKLNQRRKELKETVKQIIKQQINCTKSNTISQTQFQFFFCNSSAVENMLSAIGKIEDVNNISKLDDIKQVQAPLFSLSVDNNNLCCIQINIEEKKQGENENVEYDVKYKEEDQKEWTVTNSLILENNNIKPLTKYMVYVRYSSDNNTLKYEWSVVQSIRTTFDCVWHPKYHGNSIKLIDEHEIFVDANCSSDADSYRCSSIVSKYMLNGEILKKIKYEFIINEFCQPSMFGFVEYPLNVTMKYHWNSDSPLIENKYSFIVSAMDGLKYIRRYKHGKNTETTIFSIFNDGITLQNVIKKGDHFIFDIDFESNICNLYINDEYHKICNKQQEATWTNIPNKIYPCYSHYCDQKLVNKNSKVRIKLISYELRD